MFLNKFTKYLLTIEMWSISYLISYLSICVFYLIYKCLKKEFKILTHKSFNVRLYITLQNNYFFKLKMNFIQLIYIYTYYSNHCAPTFLRGPIRWNCSLMRLNPLTSFCNFLCIFTKNNDWRKSLCFLDEIN